MKHPFEDGATPVQPLRRLGIETASAAPPSHQSALTLLPVLTESSAGASTAVASAPESGAARNRRLGRIGSFTCRQLIFWVAEFYVIPIAVVVLWLLVPLQNDDMPAGIISWNRYLFGFRLWYACWAGFFCFPLIFFHLNVHTRWWGWVYGPAWTVLFLAIDLFMISVFRDYLESQYQFYSSLAIVIAASVTMTPSIAVYYYMARQSRWRGPAAGTATDAPTAATEQQSAAAATQHFQFPVPARASPPQPSATTATAASVTLAGSSNDSLVATPLIPHVDAAALPPNDTMLLPGASAPVSPPARAPAAAAVGPKGPAGTDSTPAPASGPLAPPLSPVDSALDDDDAPLTVAIKAAPAGTTVKRSGIARASVLFPSPFSPRQVAMRQAEAIRVSRNYIQPQPLHVCGASEPMLELPYVRTGVLNVIAGTLVLSAFFWCQVFTWIFFKYAKDNPAVQLVLSLLFSYSFLPFRVLVRLLDRLIYGATREEHAAAGAGSAPDGVLTPRTVAGASGGAHWKSRHRATTHFMFLGLEVFYFVFYRNLFISISSVSTYIGLYIVKLLNENVIRFVLPLTDWYVRFLKRIGCMHAATTADANVTHVAEDVFNRSFAGMLSICAFAAGLVVCHFGPNHEFYPLLGADLSDNQVVSLLILSGIAIGVEFLNYAIIESLMRRWYSFSVTATVLPFYQWQHQVRGVVIGFLVHFIQDVYVAQLNFRES